MTRDPLVTVIVPTYNRADLLRCALGSVVLQTLREYEVLVVGDACTDGSADVVAALGDDRFRWFNLAVNSGAQSAPNNEGLRLARGRYVAHLGHDDLWFPWHLAEGVRRLDETGADFVHGLEVDIAPKGVLAAYGPHSAGRDYLTDPLPPTTWMYRRELAARVGDWNPASTVDTWTDHDYMRRIVRSGARIESTHRLSAIRFASNLWGTYKRTEGFPQPGYLEKLKVDPAAFERALLTDALEAFARRRNPLLGSRRAIRVALETIWLRLQHRLGVRVTLPEAVRRWLFQRERIAARRHRGLDRDRR